MLCGSTNFTHNGVYRQANVVHTADRPELARKYLELFEIVFGGATPGDTKKWINVNNPLSSDAPIVAGFSPRGGEVDLDLFAAEIRGAARDVLFCTAFDLNKRILEALIGQPNDAILRFGLQNSTDTITGIHHDRTADFVATAMLNEGLEGFLKETTAGQKGNILIHTKLVVIDFTSDAPTVLSGSHNLSASASGGNDENYLIIRGAVDVADCYGVELMRLRPLPLPLAPEHAIEVQGRSGARSRRLAGRIAVSRRPLDAALLHRRHAGGRRPDALRGIRKRLVRPTGVQRGDYRVLDDLGMWRSSRLMACREPASGNQANGCNPDCGWGIRPAPFRYLKWRTSSFTASASDVNARGCR